MHKRRLQYAFLVVLWVALLAVILTVGKAISAQSTPGGPLPSASAFLQPAVEFGVGGSAFYRNGIVTQIAAVTDRSVYEVDVATWQVTRVLQDTCTWSGNPCTVLPLAGMGTAWTDKVQYSIGGSDVWLESELTNKIRRYDPVTKTVSDTGVLLPEVWIDGTAVWDPINRRAVLFAGANGVHYLDVLRIFDPERGVVEQIGTLPRIGDNGCAVYWPQRGSTIWGGGHGGGQLFADFYEVLPSGLSRLVGVLPHGIDRPACMLYNDHLIVAGGEGRPNGATETTVLDAIYAIPLGAEVGNAVRIGTLPIPYVPYAWTSDGIARMWLTSGSRGGIVEIRID